MLNLVRIQLAALPIHVSQDMLCLFFSHDRIALQVTKSFSCFNDPWSRVDTLLFRLFSSYFPLFCAVSATIPSFSAPKIFLQFRFLFIDVPLHRLVTD